jgi:hypothetical protein
MSPLYIAYLLRESAQRSQKNDFLRAVNFGVGTSKDQRDFLFSKIVQNSSAAQPASCAMSTGSTSQNDRCVATSTPHLAPSLKMIVLPTPQPLTCPKTYYGKTFTCPVISMGSAYQEILTDPLFISRVCFNA